MARPIIVSPETIISYMGWDEFSDYQLTLFFEEHFVRNADLYAEQYLG